ncbi:conserved hypothetical protein [Nitrosotalea sinensis]|uniref:Intracellular proteinase inhibitor BsuPI domain-containing protein n=1 Tax=Nitrosotalea sinensis TaxID=1499975 RepID=A0A2H1EEI9_9ARCH|nr:hypothetical protein [Candidatus Nitrosotalea sinensis]SHO42472.1 conserved hypothetical protein [Candidatus Nitrosotalea sinensis]
MIPKGAAIFFIVGLIAAGFLGIYLSHIANQIPVLVYVSGPSLTVIPDKINYHMGEPVKIRVINSGTVPLLFSDSSYGVKIEQLDGTVIYSPVSAQVVSKLEPKEEKIFVWDQTKNDGSKAYQGRYRIVSSTNDSNMLRESVTINILK